MMRVLFLTTVLPGGLRGGGEIVAQSVIDALAGGGNDVRVVGYRRPGSDAPELAGEVCAGVRPIETADAGRLRTLGWMARAVAERAPYSSAKFQSRGYVRAMRDELAAAPALVFADHAQAAFAARAVAASVPLVFLAHNAEGAMYAEAAEGAPSRVRRWANTREARRIRDAEAYLAARASQVWVLTEDDARYFRELRPLSDVRVLPVASMLEEGAGVGSPVCDVALIGTWNWGPNARGLEWFSAEVVPRLPSTMTVEVAGVGAEWLDGRHPNVAIRGAVHDAEAFLSRARVVAVPSLAGGGIQIKTLDAVACGMPVVATQIATRGIDDWPESVAIAAEASDFANQLERLAISPERERLREEALAWSRARRERLATSVADFSSALTRSIAASAPA